MDYFSKFLKGTNQPAAKPPVIDHAQEFHKSWTYVKVSNVNMLWQMSFDIDFCSSRVQSTLMQPDERQLLLGIKSTDVPAQLQSMVDALVWESTRTEEG